MKPQLSKAAAQLRLQVDDTYPDRDRRSDGTTGNPRHALTKSDHNPDAQGWVRAWDCDADLHKGGKPDVMSDLVNQIRLLCKSGVEKRISYIIYDGKIYSSILNWKPRKYTGANKHNCHAHFSFKATADNDGAFFQVPMLGASE